MLKSYQARNRFLPMLGRMPRPCHFVRRFAAAVKDWPPPAPNFRR